MPSVSDSVGQRFHQQLLQQQQQWLLKPLARQTACLLLLSQTYHRNFEELRYRVMQYLQGVKQRQRWRGLLLPTLLRRPINYLHNPKIIAAILLEQDIACLYWQWLALLQLVDQPGINASVINYLMYTFSLQMARKTIRLPKAPL